MMIALNWTLYINFIYLIKNQDEPSETLPGNSHEGAKY